jgi:hypothetical protein
VLSQQAANAQDLPILTTVEVETGVVSTEMPPVINEFNIGDDGFAQVPLQFAFPYYDRVFTNSYMFSNGVVGFLDPRTGFCCNGEDLTITTNPNINYSIMLLWTDLLNMQGSFSTEGTADYQKYFWKDISEYATADRLNTFSLEIRPDGSYSMFHEKINIQGHSYTIGAVGDLSLGEYVQHEYAPQGGIRNNVTTDGSGSVDLCSIDPLSSPTCSGYEAAFYAQQCSVNALYDVGCAGYQQAYYNYQCSIDPLYDVGCAGYENAYFTYQCSIDALYNPQCQGYAEAFYNLQCSIYALYDSGCNGYAEAYAAYLLNLTCTANSQADPRCPGYVQVAEQQNVGTIVLADATQPVSITGDPVIDSIIRIDSALVQSPNNEQLQTVQTEEASSESKEKEEEKSEEKKEEVKQAATETAKNLANKMSEAASLEAQKIIQESVLAMMNVTPGFDQYSIALDGGYYPDAAFYSETKVPESRRGLRNGLAQQILHEKMIDMQYNNN